MAKIKNTSILLPSIAVFAAVMLVTFVSFATSVSSIQQEQVKVVDQYSKEIRDNIQRRVSSYEQSLRAGVGLLSASSDVDSVVWDKFISTNGVLDRLDAIQAIGYATNKTTSATVQFVQPNSNDNRSTIGSNLLDVPILNNTILAAQSNGEVMLAGPMSSSFDNDETGEDKVVFMVAPHYDNDLDPRSNVEQLTASGYVYLFFDSNMLVQKEYEQLGIDTFAIAVYSMEDGKNELFRTANYDAALSSNEQVRSFTFSVNAATWQIDIAYDPNVVIAQTFSARSSTILVFGGLSAVLIGGVIFLLLLSKSNELALQKERDINAAKDSLLSIASHQLRTPATGVKQYLGMVLQGFVGDTSDPQTAMLKKAYESNERQLKTINDILFLARLESGRIVLNKSKVHMNQLLESIVSEQRADIDQSKHKVSVKIPKKDIYIKADGHVIRMAIENILSNAIKYTKNGGKITIRLSSKADCVSVSVQDNGVGISSEDYERLYKQFSRIQNELSKSVSGSGVGLYLVHQIAMLHNGSITHTTPPSGGSIFTIKIPKSDSRTVK